MFNLNGLLLLLLDLSVICGQTAKDDSIGFEGQATQDNSTAFKETYNATHSNHESFPDQSYFNSYNYCNEKIMEDYGEFCCRIFNESMIAIPREKWCNMEMVVRSYSLLTDCMEKASMLINCYYPNPVVEQHFVRIHRQYFSSCNNEEDLTDAPAGVVLVATLLPILLIPFIVYIVVWKSSLKD